MVENGYRDVVMPFEEYPAPAVSMSLAWNLDQLLGYLRTWSAMKKYEQETGSDPVTVLRDDLKQAWQERPDREHPVHWPLSIRIWRKQATGQDPVARTESYLRLRAATRNRRALSLMKPSASF
jgi:hypothetical protein